MRAILAVAFAGTFALGLVLDLVLALALGLPLGLWTPADAATLRHPHPRHDVITHPSGDAALPPGWYKFPGYPPIPPEQNRNLDPSNRGGG